MRIIESEEGLVGLYALSAVLLDYLESDFQCILRVQSHRIDFSSQGESGGVNILSYRRCDNFGGRELRLRQDLVTIWTGDRDSGRL